MFNFHTHVTQKNAIINIDDNKNLVLKNNYYYSLGIHPWYNTISIEEVEKQILSHQQIIAIGECGIDKIKSAFSLDEQIHILKQQIKLSEKHQLPLILHIVKGFNEIIKLKKDLKPKQPWVIHGFNNYKQTQTLIDNGFYLSFGKALLTNIKLQKVFKSTPIQQIFLETDDTVESDSYLIEKIYTFAAGIKKMALKDLILQIDNNLTTLFNGKLARKT